MRTLVPTLLDYDPSFLAIIAHRWDVDLASLDKHTAAETLAAAMLDPDRAATEWGRLTDAERGALQTLLGAPEHKMPEVQFSRFFGEIRQMGPGRREREKPYLNPVSVAETLYFRGLIALGFHQGKAGMQTFAYVPTDLAGVLPTHETGFDLEAEAGDGRPSVGDGAPESVKPATTTAVDDMTTLLAYLQVEDVPSEKETLRQQVIQALAPYWLGDNHPDRAALLLSLAGSMGLAANEDGLFKPVSVNARHWLDNTRPRQVRALAEAWRDTTLFNDLWHTPGLLPEDTGWRNDPLLARQTVLTFLEMVPPDQWWPVADLVALVKAEEPDFQRPAGDYDSWYIRDAEGGDYLQGFESWDRVDGAVLWFILTGPMHWLGLLDRGDDGARGRLTIYGRARVGETEWPDPPEERAQVTIQADGTLQAPRTLSRYERFQLARFTEWVSSGDPYVYELTITGLQRAAKQDIHADAIQAFLRRASGNPLPDALARVLQQWDKTGRADVWLSQAIILRTDDSEALQAIVNEPNFRRYLGAQLGPNAVIVRAGQEHDLVSALRQQGILAEFDS
jgi:hypothetical protein